MKILLIAILVLCQTAAAFAQTKKFRWGNELCEFEGTYDAKKYSEAQLKDTVKLFYLDYFPNSIDPTPDEYTNIKNLNVGALDAEYRTRTDELKRLNIVKTAYWETLRRRHLKELEQVYQLSRASILGYADPAKLKDVKFAEACVVKYANPLIEGSDRLLAVWRELNEESRKNNIDPRLIKRIFDEQYNSPEKFQHAQIEVMRFGWWNCANARINREDRAAESEKEFKKLFKRTRTVECDEP